MIRGTTAIHIFTFPFAVNMLTEVWITYSQRNVEILTKQLAECEADGNKLTVHLTQEDTLLFQENCYTQIQIRCKDNGGNAIASNIIKDFTEKILKDGVI